MNLCKIGIHKWVYIKNNGSWLHDGRICFRCLKKTDDKKEREEKIAQDKAIQKRARELWNVQYDEH